MKRLLALLLAMVMLLSLAACGDKKEEDDDDEKSSTTKLKLKLEETVIADTDDFTITVTDVEKENGSTELTLTVKIENKSDKDLTFDLETCSLCGLSYPAYLYTDVAAGKKANEELYIDTDIFERYGLKYLTDIALGFEVFETDNYYSDTYYALLDPVHVYPYGEENASTFTLEAEDSHVVLLDNEYVTVTAIGSHEEDWAYTVDYYIVNKCDDPIDVSANSISVNDYMISTWFDYRIQPGEAILESMYFYDSDLEEIGVKKVESVEFTFFVTDTAEWETLSEDILVYEP